MRSRNIWTRRSSTGRLKTRAGVRGVARCEDARRYDVLGLAASAGEDGLRGRIQTIGAVSDLSGGKGDEGTEKDTQRRQHTGGSYFTRLVRLSYLAPDITQAILDGRQPRDLTAEKLLEHSRLPLAWHDQRTVLGFA